MTRRFDLFVPGIALILSATLLATGCSTTAETARRSQAAIRLPFRPPRSQSRSIDRYLRVTGSLKADAQAEVSAETAGRVVETPVERGTRVTQGTAHGAHLVRGDTAQLQEAESNAAQIEARLGLDYRHDLRQQARSGCDERQASLELAEAEFNRMRTLVDQKVVSQSEFDQRRTQVEAARQKYQVEQNTAQHPIDRWRLPGRGLRWRERRWPTRPSVHRSPGSSPSVSSALETTSPAGRASPRSCEWIR